MRSPFFEGLVRADWGPAPGSAALISQGNSALANGIANLGQSVGGAIEKHLDEQKLITKKGKTADALVEQYPALLKAVGVQSVEQFKNIGADRKAAALDALAYQDMTSQMQSREAMTDYHRQQASALQAAAAQQQSDNALLERAAQNFNPSPVRFQPNEYLTGDSIVNGYLSAPSPARPEQLPQVLQTFAAQHPAASRRMGILDEALKASAGETGAPVVDTVPLPFGNQGAVLRGSRDLKVFNNPQNVINAKQTMTEGQRAALRTKAFGEVLQSRKYFNALKGFKDENGKPYPDNVLSDAQATLQMAEEEYRSLGGKLPGDGAPAAPAGKVRKYNPATGKIE